MKMTLKLMLLAFIFMALFSSCNKEELFTEPTAEEITNPTTPEEETPEDNEEVPGNASLPCDFNLNNLQPNQTVIINCMMDLQGATIQVPSGVTLLYEGGDIKNGTLNFSSNTTISGELLNNTITLTGSNPIMKDPIFEFVLNKWGIVEGKVSNDVALNNRNILQSLIDRTKLMGVEVFEIDKMDAYFHFNYGWKDAKGYDDMAIHLPSDFHLKMTDNTHLRLQPNNWPKGVFLSIYEKENVKISGGNIHGDRFTHDYSDILDEVGISRATHEWPGLVVIAGSVNIIVDSIYITDATGDAFIFGASNGFRHLLPNKSYNKNVILKNSTLNASRRNNISITDGEDLTIENCIIANAGNGDNIYDASGSKIISSAGIAPKVGIDIEPYRGWNQTDGFISYEKVERVYIRGCTFTNNNVASFIDYSGVDVTVENCTSDNGFTSSYSTRGKYLNNKLIASDKNKNATGLTMGSMAVSINGIEQELSENNIVKGNTVEGFVIGVLVRSNNSEVSDNSFLDCWVGLKILKTENTIFDNNDFKSSRTTDSRAISFFDGVAKNLTISNMTVDMPRHPLDLVGLNKNNNNYSLNFVNCTFKSQQGYSILVKDTPNITFTNTTLSNTTFQVTNSPNFVNN